MIHSQKLDVLVHRYEWAAASMGLAGNMAFFAGSLLYAWGVSLPAKVLFVVASFGMLVRSLARLYVDRRKRHRGQDLQTGAGMAQARREAETAAV